MMDIDDLFNEYGAIAHERQGRLAELIGDRGWQFDMDRSTIAFGKIETPGCFSTTSTRAPARAAAIAVVRPDGPAPMISTS